jgi:hypothetical protein
MNRIEMQVNHKKVKIHLSNYVYDCFEYMNSTKDLKKRVRNAVITNEQNKSNLGICSWHFISSHLEYPNFKLTRLTENEFIVEKIGE